MKIMLDAGHYGYKNQSPVLPEYYESRQMWKLCELLFSELGALGFEVFKTRTDIDKDLSVVKRGEMAKGCDLFISLHTNAVGGSGNESVNRVDVYAPYDNINGSHVLGAILAETVAECMGISKSYVKTRKSDRGDWEYYGVLRGARSVGCPLYYIIEHSFHTNKRSAAWLMSDENLARLARVEALAIATYFGVNTDYEIGDVNMNGRYDSSDLILIKRAYFNNVTLTDEQLRLADINGDGEFDVFDYIAAKRKYFEGA